MINCTSKLVNALESTQIAVLKPTPSLQPGVRGRRTSCPVRTSVYLLARRTESVDWPRVPRTYKYTEQMQSRMLSRTCPNLLSILPKITVTLILNVILLNFSYQSQISKTWDVNAVSQHVSKQTLQETCLQKLLQQ